MKLYLIVGEITCPDAISVYQQQYGGTYNIGDPEYRLADDPVNPGVSYDFPTREAAIAWAQNKTYELVFSEEK